MICDIDFLPVGESNGDAIFVAQQVTENGWHLYVIDGGYTDTSERIISHIRRYFGDYWCINHVVLSHADNDHAAGLIGVLERATVLNLWMNRPWLYVDDIVAQFHGNFSTTGLAAAIKRRYPNLVRLEQLALERGATIREVFQGTQIGAFRVLAPSRERYIQSIPDLDKTPQRYAKDTSVAKAMGLVQEAIEEWLDEHWDLETLSANPQPVSASNETSVVQMGVFGDRKVLLTADAGPIGLSEAADYAEAAGLHYPYPALVQVPHHGSRKNVTPKILDRILGGKMPYGKRYAVAFCSVGSDEDDYPRGQVKNAFMRRGYPVWATKGRTITLRFGPGQRPGFGPIEPLPWSKKVKA